MVFFTCLNFFRCACHDSQSLSSFVNLVHVEHFKWSRVTTKSNNCVISMHYRKTLTTTIAELNARHKMKKRWKMHKRKPFSSFNSTAQHRTALNDSENENRRTKETIQNQTNRRINEEKEEKTVRISCALALQERYNAQVNKNISGSHKINKNFEFIYLFFLPFFTLSPLCWPVSIQ